MSKRGFTLIELLVVIAIIAVLAAILFPVFAQAREKSMQSACLSNQKQIATAILMYVQDNDETMPSSSTVWKNVNLGAAVLVCPTKGKSFPNGYVFNNTLSAMPLGNIAKSGQIIMTADGMHAGSLSGTITYDNVAYTTTDYDFRHKGQIVATYDDGHAMLTNSTSMSSASLWLRADNGTTLSGFNLTSWQSYGSTLATSYITGSPTWNMTGVNGTGINNCSAIQFTAGYADVMPPGALTVQGFTLFYVFQTVGTPTASDSMFVFTKAGNGQWTRVYMTNGQLEFTNSANPPPSGGSWTWYDITTTSPTPFNDNKPHLLVLNVPANASLGTKPTFTVDGTQAPTGGVGGNGSIWPINLNGGYMGLFGIYASYSMTSGDKYNVGEVIFYPSQLDDMDIALQTTYLRSKYGI